MNARTHQKKQWMLTILVSVFTSVLIVFLLPAFLKVHAAQAGQRQFSAPEDAVKALIHAMEISDTQELQIIFGSAGKKILSSGDAVEDRADKEKFLRAYQTKNILKREGDAKAVLHVGEGEWPFPVPIVKKADKWSFDAKAGDQELMNRRIGRNELSTILICLAYVDGQREYATKDRDGDGLLEYAQQFVSTPGKKDGLYWKTEADGEESPFGDLAAKAAREGYKKSNNKPMPYHGYYFKILKAQGRNAAGGAFDYIVKGNMIGGFGLVAYPAKYGVSGVMTFVVNHEGVVYEKNLGKDTAKIAQRLHLFDPDKSWNKITDGE